MYYPDHLGPARCPIRTGDWKFKNSHDEKCSHGKEAVTTPHRAALNNRPLIRRLVRWLHAVGVIVTVPSLFKFAAFLWNINEFEFGFTPAFSTRGTGVPCGEVISHSPNDTRSIRCG